MGILGKSTEKLHVYKHSKRVKTLKLNVFLFPYLLCFFVSFNFVKNLEKCDRGTIEPLEDPRRNIAYADKARSMKCI